MIAGIAAGGVLLVDYVSPLHEIWKKAVAKLKTTT